MQAPTSAAAALSPGPISHGFCLVHAHAGSSLPAWVVLNPRAQRRFSYIHPSLSAMYLSSRPRGEPIKPHNRGLPELGFAGPIQAGSPKDFTLILGENSDLFQESKQARGRET